MVDKQFINDCAQALYRAHGEAALDVVTSQVTALQNNNPVAAWNWTMVGAQLNLLRRSLHLKS